MAPNPYIRQVGNSFARAQLNYRNMVFHSRVTQFERKETDSGLSLKMVLRGRESYTIGNTTHHITPGSFLLVNEHQQFHCKVHSKEEVEGLCIYLDPEIVREAYSANTKGHAALLDDPACSEHGRNDFLEKIYGLQENRLGHFLQEKAPLLRNGQLQSARDLNEFFVDLAEKLVLTQQEVSDLLGKLEMERPATREEIFRRVSMARNYIDGHFLEDIALDELAGIACLSKYHFLRCFKQVYGYSPYQYVLRRRLEKGKELLRQTAYSLTEIAYLTGFTDRRAFNKAFKKSTGTSPREYRVMA